MLQNICLLMYHLRYAEMSGIAFDGIGVQRTIFGPSTVGRPGMRGGQRTSFGEPPHRHTGHIEAVRHLGRVGRVGPTHGPSAVKTSMRSSLSGSDVELSDPPGRLKQARSPAQGGRGEYPLLSSIFRADKRNRLMSASGPCLAMYASEILYPRK